jgi:hypothetical protein
MLLVAIHESLLFIKGKNILHFVALGVSGLIFTALSIVIFYDPFNSVKSGGIFAFSPLAIPHNLIEDPDALYIPQFVMARYSLLSANRFSLRLFAIETITLGIYLVYNFGSRIIGWFYLLKQIVKRKITRFELTLLITIAISIIFTVTLVQRGGDWWNTVQFFGYGLLLANIFAASALYEIMHRYRKLGFCIAIIVVFLTLPLNIELVMRAIERLNKPYDISLEEQEALAFLKEKKDKGAVFALPVFSKLSYVPARSGKPVFFADETVISNQGIDFTKRKELLLNLKDIQLESLPVRYFYLAKYDKDYELVLDKVRNSSKLKKIYDNKEVIIFERL